MKIKTFILCLVFTASTCFAQNRKIQFETSSFDHIKAKAKTENRLIFVDAYTTWCGPCKYMAENIFTNDTVADFFNAKFINAQIDMEKGEGIKFAKQYDVLCYPNLLFIDGDGNLIHRGAGALEVKEFIQFAEDAQNPEKRFSKYKNEFESRKSDPKFIYEYLTIISQTCLPFDIIVIDYFKTVKDEDLANRANWNVIRDYSSNYKSREFIFLLNNVETFSEKFTPDSVNSKIKYVLINSGYNIINNPEMKDEDYMSFKSEISKFNFSNIEEVIFQLDMSYFYRKEDWKNFVDLAVEKGDKYFLNAMDFNNISWMFYQHTDDVIALQKAETWMQKALEDKESEQWFVYDTYAAILFKLNKKAEAKTAALKAIELAKSSGISKDEYKPTRELLEKIEKL